MNIFKFTCLFVMVLNCVVAIFFAEQRTPGKQMVFMATSAFAFVLLLLSLLVGFCMCFREKLRAFIPALICIIGLPAGFFIGGQLGGVIKDWRFQKNLPRYIEVIHLIEKGEVKKSSDSYVIELPAQFSDLAQRTWMRTNADGALIVEFITELGFPVKHSGYLYVSSGKVEGDPDTLRRWHYRSQINTNWFRITD